MRVTGNVQHFDNTDEMQRVAARCGSHFFERETMRAFGSKIYADLYAGCIFITSEQDKRGFGELGQAWNGARLYTVRMATVELRDDELLADVRREVEATEVRNGADGNAYVRLTAPTVRGLLKLAAYGEQFNITTLGAFGEYETLGTARTAARRFARMLETFGEVHALEMGGINILPRSERSQWIMRCVCGQESAPESSPELAEQWGADHVAPYAS